jgi:hypothetical protein
LNVSLWRRKGGIESGRREVVVLVLFWLFSRDNFESKKKHTIEADRLLSLKPASTHRIKYR